MTIEEFKKEWFGQSEFVHAHTSGSTGAPKDILLAKRDMVASAEATNAFFGINDTSVLAIPLAIDYIAGKMMAVRAWVAGCQLKVIKPSNTFDYDGKSDLLAIVASQADWLIAHPEWAKTTRNVIVGGSRLMPAKARALIDCGYNVYSTYGMTETASHVALCHVNGGDEVYRSLPDICFEVDDSGCLVIVAPKFSFRRLQTNDVVELIDAHSFRWQERYDHVINSGGIKIFPSEIERLLADKIALPFYVSKIADEKWGERPILYIESTMPIENIEEVVKNSLPRLFWPEKIEYMPVFNRTDSGKIIKKY